MPNKVTLVGFDDFIQKMKGLPKQFLDEIDGEVLETGREWEQRAKMDAPVDLGALRANITTHQPKYLEAEVSSRMEYSAYVEWGTGTRVSVPAELADYAIQFKGTKQTVGRYPHPFFFIQRPFVEKFFIEQLKRVLTRER